MLQRLSLLQAFFFKLFFIVLGMLLHVGMYALWFQLFFYDKNLFLIEKIKHYSSERRSTWFVIQILDPWWRFFSQILLVLRAYLSILFQCNLLLTKCVQVYLKKLSFQHCHLMPDGKILACTQTMDGIQLIEHRLSCLLLSPPEIDSSEPKKPQDGDVVWQRNWSKYCQLSIDKILNLFLFLHAKTSPVPFKWLWESQATTSYSLGTDLLSYSNIRLHLCVLDKLFIY